MRKELGAGPPGPTTASLAAWGAFACTETPTLGSSSDLHAFDWVSPFSQRSFRPLPGPGPPGCELGCQRPLHLSLPVPEPALTQGPPTPLGSQRTCPGACCRCHCHLRASSPCPGHLPPPPDCGAGLGCEAALPLPPLDSHQLCLVLPQSQGSPRGLHSPGPPTHTVPPCLRGCHHPCNCSRSRLPLTPHHGHGHIVVLYSPVPPGAVGSLGRRGWGVPVSPVLRGN